MRGRMNGRCMKNKGSYEGRQLVSRLVCCKRFLNIFHAKIAEGAKERKGLLFVIFRLEITNSSFLTSFSLRSWRLCGFA